MVEREFDNSGGWGGIIAKAKGRFRTYLKKRARRLPLALAAAVVLALAIKATSLEAVRVTSDTLSPRVPAHSRLLVNKLSRQIDVNDVIVFRLDGEYKLGIVSRTDPRGDVVVHRKGNPETPVRRDQIVGKAIFLYSYAL